MSSERQEVNKKKTRKNKKFRRTHPWLISIRKGRPSPKIRRVASFIFFSPSRRSFVFCCQKMRRPSSIRRHRMKRKHIRRTQSLLTNKRLTRAPKIKFFYKFFKEKIQIKEFQLIFLKKINLLWSFKQKFNETLRKKKWMDDLDVEVRRRAGENGGAWFEFRVTGTQCAFGG